MTESVIVAETDLAKVVGGHSAEPRPLASVSLGGDGIALRGQSRRVGPVHQQTAWLGREREAVVEAVVGWLRPAFQHPTAQAAPEQAELAAGQGGDEAAAPAAAAKPLPWPKDAVAQVRAVADALAASPVALDADALATRFTARGPWKKRLPQLLDMLVELGRAREQGSRYSS